ncbi:hypothetical protein BN8_06684 [Fibrisoma limi BUZ 3]|uniref:DUF1593 domain-containing protein n=1 Tax=Fibrisoma limi BUZ 3 TaxID=1185876 RepID=I2GTP3_9BACT|nr:nucleoside hydrolase-like domain-containing protein [Fibrisoma limi]CCH57273.1 hypothetical protein BN8_06684 [Fibrisoma limi BUZ 3]
MKLILSLFLILTVVASYVRDYSGPIQHTVHQKVHSDKPRVIILTDISSLDQKQGEPDDGQSLIRLMLYTNELEVEGLIASSNLRHGQIVRPELIQRVISAYGQVHRNLLNHSAAYPPAAQLNQLVRAGQPVAGPGQPLENSVGAGKDTEASDWIIQVVDQADPRPVWVCIWGGSADLAQALWKVRQTRSADAIDAFVAKLRVHAIYDQDQTGPWIREQFPNLFYILRNHGIRGMYRGGDRTLLDSVWVAENIQHGHGPLGALYVNYRGGDIWSRQLGPVMGIKEGDTPSFLGLLSNGLNVWGQPELGGWGGRFRRKQQNQYVEAVDSVGQFADDPDPRMAAVYRWREAWQHDFQARLDWCTKSYLNANHPPVAVIRNGAKELFSELNVPAGTSLALNGEASRDPDGDRLRFRWLAYPNPGAGFPEPLSEQTNLNIQIPAAWKGRRISIVLDVTDTGSPNLTSYRRLLIEVQ